MKKLASLIVFWGLIMSSALAWAEDKQLAEIFQELKVNGTIVISSLDGTRTYIHNDARARERLRPASTFKIANTLIALEEGAVADGREILKWNGKKWPVSAWNKDQSIEIAFPVSCVWFYQELAKRVGLERYRSYLQKMNYGNAQADPDVTTFWLDGNLAISALEQVDFLRDLYKRRFPFRASSYDLLRQIMLFKKTPDYAIRAKTGWTTAPPPVGWLVGYVESGDHVWLFATNIDMSRAENAPLRKRITLDALAVKGIIK